LVSKAKASVFTLEYISQFEPADIDSDDVDLRLEVGGRDTGTNVSIVDECGQAAKVIGAQVEALEKAQQRIVELESRTVTVKLPEPPGPMSVGARTVYFGIVADVVGAFQDGLNAAGIKVEAE
ncbi:TPA: ead/Ea22-like family protein, partial [Klebsiella quasipneumoniae]|nr:ead/Ea22-like family protein [Klebsiella quasipneumoniae]